MCVSEGERAGRHMTEHRESAHAADAIRLNGIRPITFLPAVAPQPPGRGGCGVGGNEDV